jgi:Cu/Zn superoxide dismutase
MEEGGHMHWLPIEGPRRRRFRWGWLALAFGAAACQPPADDMTEGAEYGGEPESAIGANDIEAPDTLYATPIESTDSMAATVSGELAVVAEDRDEPLELVVRGRGLTPGEHGWHVHAGSCEASGGVSIALSETREIDGITDPIEVNDQGEFEASVDVPGLSRTTVGRGEHSVHIHQRGGADHGPAVACATI